MAIRHDRFLAILSGRRTDTAATLARPLLGVASVGYCAAVRLRNALYDRKVLRSHEVRVPVVSVGNLTAGGTGKTPLVVWLARCMGTRFRCAILTRGYKARMPETKGQGPDPRPSQPVPTYSDEVGVLARALPGVQIVVNPDRTAGAHLAIRQGAQVLILDDGFQHRTLARDLDIVTIDALNPFGYGRPLPAGLLREPVGSLRRAQAAVLTRADLKSEADLEALEQEIRRAHPGLVIARSMHAPTHVMLLDGRTQWPGSLQARRVFAFCGIGNPEAFLGTLRRVGAEVVGSEFFDDHHAFTGKDLDLVLRKAQDHGADMVLTTEKNAVGLSQVPGSIPAGYLAIELRFLAGEAEVRGLIDRTLAGTMASG